MSKRADVSGSIAGNDLRFDLVITYQGAVLDLTGLPVIAVLKPRNTSPDTDGITYALGTGLTVTDAAAGELTWDVPKTDTAVPGVSWYRVDVTDSEGRDGTALYGTFGLTAA